MSKRFHVHLHVDALERSIDFYSRLFAAAPTRRESDYAKWMLEDPPVNFAISTRGHAAGIDHLGIQTDNPEELAALQQRARQADLALEIEGETTCCYARSEKHWVTDPQGIAWEHFHTLADVPVFSEKPAPATVVAGSAATAAEPARACCAPAAAQGKPVAIAVKSASSCC